LPICPIKKPTCAVVVEARVPCIAHAVFLAAWQWPTGGCTVASHVTITDDVISRGTSAKLGALVSEPLVTNLTS